MPKRTVVFEERVTYTIDVDESTTDEEVEQLFTECVHFGKRDYVNDTYTHQSGYPVLRQERFQKSLEVMNQGEIE